MMKTRLIQIRPRRDQYYIAHSRSVLITDSNGLVQPETYQGLYVYETRSISKIRYLVNSKPIEPVSASTVHHHSWLGYFRNRFPAAADSQPSQSVELRISRFAGNGLHEEIDFTNYGQREVEFNFCIELDADFADLHEAGSKNRSARGAMKVEWREGPPSELSFSFFARQAFDHQGEKGIAQVHQSIAARITHATSSPTYSDGRVIFAIELAPKGIWHSCLDFIPTLDGKTLPPLYSCGALGGISSETEKQEKFLREKAARFTIQHSGTLASDVAITADQAAQDLAALRLFDLDREDGWTVAAGWPEFVALFGRDAMTAAWQASLLSADVLRGTLPAIAALQGKSDNPWRDEQPGKMPHQASTRLTSLLNLNPFRRYYGSISASAIFPFALAALWQQTGDSELVASYVDAALESIRWRDTYGDLDGDGFGEYLCRSEKGLKNQGWKDSGAAIVYEDGSLVEPPIATCEEQGFLYIAKLRMAELLWWIRRRDEAKRLFHEASELKKRFNGAFWMEDLGYFAMGLDSHKRRIRSIASNPGHLLATAIADDSLVRRTANRLMQPDLFSGWGIRTLSTEHPAYDPFAYQRGCVWPVENGVFALGFLRYGLQDYAEQLCRAQFEAARLFENHRLPEAFAGHPMDDRHPFPAAYAEANWPQAWSSATIYLYLSALLGIFPYAPLNLLFVDPHLPEWLPEMRMSNFHVGQAIIDIHFYRKEDGSSDYEIKDVKGKLHVIRQPSPWSLTAGWGERFLDVLQSFLPNH
jgi:glycogen debranching enzyme